MRPTRDDSIACLPQHTHRGRDARLRRPTRHVMPLYDLSHLTEAAVNKVLSWVIAPLKTTTLKGGRYGFRRHQSSRHGSGPRCGRPIAEFIRAISLQPCHTLVAF